MSSVKQIREKIVKAERLIKATSDASFTTDAVEVLVDAVQDILERLDDLERTILDPTR